MQPTAPLQRALRRLPLTTKQGPHNFYKGNRTGAMGRHTKHGGYIIEFEKVRTYVCPDLLDFNVSTLAFPRGGSVPKGTLGSMGIADGTLCCS